MELSTNKDKSNDDSQKKKYEILYKKDQEMTEYIKNYDQNTKKELEEIQSFETQICDVLQNASKSLMMMKQLTSKGKGDFKEL